MTEPMDEKRLAEMEIGASEGLHEGITEDVLELIAEVRRLQAERKPCLTCGYSAWVVSVESGDTWCRVCDLAGRARDAEGQEHRFREECNSLRDQLAAEWKRHGKLVDACLAYVRRPACGRAGEPSDG